MSSDDRSLQNRWPILKRRAELLTGLRQFLIRGGYWEVETPIISHDVCVEAHIDPFVTHFSNIGSTDIHPEIAGHKLFLQASPEFGMKRMLAQGSGSIFQVTRSFRNGERGILHNPEFTIVEWYKEQGGYETSMAEVGCLIQEVAGLSEPELVSYRDAFICHANLDPFDASTTVLADRSKKLGFVQLTSPGSGRSSEFLRDDYLNFILATQVEPHLGVDRPCLLHDYPASQAALAQIRIELPPVSERFELYVHGVEVCNGYHELNDSKELRCRFERENDRRVHSGRLPLPVDSRFLKTVDAVPDCSGVALGFDRLTMIALGMTDIREVLAFPFDYA